MTLLRYSRAELDVLQIWKICEQFEEYCAFRNIPVSDGDDAEYYTERVI